VKARNIGRRDFLRRVRSTVLATIGFPYVVSSSALGKNGYVAGSERIVMGAIGTGGQGTRHIGGGIWVEGGGFLSKPDVQFAAVCDVNAKNRDNAKNIVNRYYGSKDCAAYKDFQIGRAHV
jgi:hypothetical protein